MRMMIQRPNDILIGNMTALEVRDSLLASFRRNWTPPKPKPKPSAEEKAQQQWAKAANEKPIEVVKIDAAKHNAELFRRLRAQYEADEYGWGNRRFQYQRIIDRAWQQQLNIQADVERALALRPSFHRGPGDADW